MAKAAGNRDSPFLSPPRQRPTLQRQTKPLTQVVRANPLLWREFVPTQIMNRRDTWALLRHFVEQYLGLVYQLVEFFPQVGDAFRHNNFSCSEDNQCFTLCQCPGRTKVEMLL